MSRTEVVAVLIQESLIEDQRQGAATTSKEADGVSTAEIEVRRSYFLVEE